MEDLSVREQHLVYARNDLAKAEKLDTAFGTQFKRYAMWQCGHCGLEFAAPRVAPPDNWYDELYQQLLLYPALRWEFQVVCAAVQKSQTVVDFGCGSGFFLGAVATCSAHAVGFDFSASAVNAARAQGFDARKLVPTWAEADEIAPLAADHVTAFHVLEHLVEPANLFRFAQGVGSSDVKLWIAVPSNRRASRVYGEQDALDAPPHHLTRWTPAALKAVALNCGWSMQEFRYEPIAMKTAVWEITRRQPRFQRTENSPELLKRPLRRALALATWANGEHRRSGLSGFSMLACFTRRAK